MTAIATGWRGTMQDSEDKQTCPFCGAEWGHCDHYNLLVEWESYAEKVERKAKPAPHSDEHDDGKEPRPFT